MTNQAPKPDQEESSPASPEGAYVEIKLAEYQATQATYLHYDAFRWQAGSFLIAGVFIFWGLLVQRSTDPDVVAAGSVLVTSLMSIWLLFAHHYRQIYLAKLHRLREIERELGMEQHRRFVGQGRTPYRTFGIRGHHLDIDVYLLTVIGIPLLATARNGFAWQYLISLPIAAATVATVIVNERRINELLPVTPAE